ncbi:MAG: peptidase S58 family protein, partial [Holophagales bacterium]|nr:peptidase S58 family protein [Holophagales bacterium]
MFARCGLRIAALVALALGAWSPGVAEEAAGDPGLTAVAGLRVGQFTYEERPTGCTVVLALDGAVGAVDVRGGAPATRETALLSPHNMIQELHAVVLTGGSAYGLDASGGVMRYLEEQDVGYRVGAGVVPIVVAASLMDLGMGGASKPRPDADCGYRAAAAAGTGPVAQGNVGARARPPGGEGGGRRGRIEGGLRSPANNREQGSSAGRGGAA